jgi:hypothetical protein
VSIWKDLIDYANTWCDFKPVDWMVWDFFRIHGYCTECDGAPKKTVKHIGGVSSRWGVVSNAEEEEKEQKLLKRAALRAAAIERAKKAKEKLRLNSEESPEKQ